MLQTIMQNTKQELKKQIQRTKFKTIDNKNIQISSEQLGSGTYGAVNFGYIRNTDTIVAVKMIDKNRISHHINQIYPNSEENRKSALNNFLKNQKLEIEILRTVSHENIVNCYNISETVNTVYIVLEYEPSGYFTHHELVKCDLRSVIMSGQVTRFQRVQYLLDIAEALSFLYEKNIFHRDLKPENVIIQNKRAKITDFGQSKSMSAGKDLEKQQTLFVGSPYYRAIQILQNQNYSIKCDVWSFGVLAYVLFYNTLPWGQVLSDQMLINKARSPIDFNPNLNVPERVRGLILSTIKINEQQRWNANQVVQECRIIYEEEKAKNYN